VFKQMMQRRLLRELAVYLAAAWVLIEVADIIVPRLGLSPMIVTYLILFALLGTPFVVLMAWRYDFGWSGGVGPRLPIPVLLASIGTAAALSWGAMSLLPTNLSAELPLVDVTPDESRLGVAVLPFRTEGGIGANIGVQLADDLILRLSRSSDLKVISRNSSFRLAEQGLASPEITRRLGVDRIIDGVIRSRPDGAVLSLEIIDEGGFPIWSYEQALSEDSANHSELAIAVSQFLLNRLGSEQAELMRRGALSDNELANDLYIQARDAYRRRTAAAMAEAIPLYEQAIRLDPSFGRAYSGLEATFSESHWGDMWSSTIRIGMEAYWRALDSSSFFGMGDARGASTLTLQRALELDPDNGEALAIQAELGAIQRGRYDYNDIERALRHPIQVDPGSVYAHEAYADFCAATARWPCALTHRRFVVALDPASAQPRVQLADVLMAMELYDDAEQALEDAQQSFGAEEASQAIGLRRMRLEVLRAIRAGDFGGIADLWDRSLEDWNRRQLYLTWGSLSSTDDPNFRPWLNSTLAARRAHWELALRLMRGERAMAAELPSDGYGFIPILFHDELGTLAARVGSDLWSAEVTVGFVRDWNFSQQYSYDNRYAELWGYGYYFEAMDEWFTTRISDRFTKYGPGPPLFESTYWLPLSSHLRDQPEFLAMIEESGLPDLWDEVGWPDVCHRDDDEDLVCD
jgi:TolB-like protein